MKKKLYTIAVLLAFAIAVTSCLGNSEDAEVTVYDDTAMGTFSLSAVNRYIHTTGKSGNDSVYTTKLTVANYPFTIDQYQRKIYNTDSLPADCDMKHILVSATATSYSGIIAIKSPTSDSLAYFNSGDSLDFSTPRVFRVYNNTGAKYRDYQVQINVKSPSQSSKMTWKQMPEGTVMPVTPTTGWSFTYNAAGDGIVASFDNGAEVIEETLDEDSRLLPKNGTFTSWDLYNGFTYALLVGNCDAQDKYMSVWRKVIDNDKPTSSSWVYIPIEANNIYGLPKLQENSNYFLLPYIDGSVFAIDGNGNIYQSRDQGITWKTSSALTSPISSVKAAIADDEGGIWLMEGTETGTIWYGSY